MADRSEAVEAVTTAFTCHHPYARRRTYTVQAGDVEATCEVCWECRAARTTTGPWLSRSYLYSDGNLLEIDGRLRIPGYFAWRDRAPVTP